MQYFLLPDIAAIASVVASDDARNDKRRQCKWKFPFASCLIFPIFPHADAGVWLIGKLFCYSIVLIRRRITSRWNETRRDETSLLPLIGWVAALNSCPSFNATRCRRLRFLSLFPVCLQFACSLPPHYIGAEGAPASLLNGVLSQSIGAAANQCFKLKARQRLSSSHPPFSTPPIVGNVLNRKALFQLC